MKKIAILCILVLTFVVGGAFTDQYVTSGEYPGELFSDFLVGEFDVQIGDRDGNEAEMPYGTQPIAPYLWVGSVRSDMDFLRLTRDYRTGVDEDADGSVCIQHPMPWHTRTEVLVWHDGIHGYAAMGPQVNGRREILSVAWSSSRQTGAMFQGTLCFDSDLGMVGGYDWCKGAAFVKHEIKALEVEAVSCGRRPQRGERLSR